MSCDQCKSLSRACRDFARIGLFIGLLALINAGCSTSEPAPKVSKGLPPPLMFDDPRPLSASATAPATAGASQGTYLTLGAVVAEANSKPIFADRILAELETPLAVKARQLDSTHFQAEARKLIEAKVSEEVNDEIGFVAAERSLAPEEKSLVESLTTDYRRRKIAEAGGSEAVARMRARQEEGVDLDELVAKQNRRLMVRLFYEKRITPRVQITADDMRRYYDINRERLGFAGESKISLRVIKIDWQRSGGRDKALDKFKRILELANKGEDFAKLSEDYNSDDERLKRLKGLSENVSKGSFVVPEVEAAAWKLDPGQISPEPVAVDDAYYMVKTESRAGGAAIQFEDARAQSRIRRDLESRQMNALYQQEISKLMSGAISRIDPAGIDKAVQMAMQRYSEWTAQATNAHAEH